MTSLAAVVLAGGAARRLGGVGKPTIAVGGRPLILRVLDAVPDCVRIVVGPPDLAGLLPPGVRLTREEPAGGGPVAGLAAAVGLLPAGTDHVAVLAADLPFLTAAAVAWLRAELDGDAAADVAVFVEGSGARQWSCAVWRCPSLMRRLDALGDPMGASMRALAAETVTREVAMAVPAGPPPWLDCDTDDDIRRAEEWLHADLG